MTLPSNDAVGKLILRLVLGLLILPHGISKLLRGVEGIATNLGNHGLPGFVAYGVYAGEVVAPLLLIIGFYARAGALLIVINMLVAIALVHSAEVFGLARNGGLSLELQYMYLVTAVSVMLLGPGRYALNEK